MSDQDQPGVELLRAAAVQLIGAARTFLDAAEQVVQDPKAVTEVVAAVGAVAKSALAALVPPGATDDDEQAPGDGVQHIDVR